MSGKTIILVSLHDLKNLYVMCYNPINIINPTKYISLKYRDSYVLQVPCGHCAECLQQKSNEWSYRLYHHALQTFKDGFVLFDTLTYDNAHLPHISDYLNVDKSVDFPCFSSRDIRLFIADLRQRCKRKFKSNFAYFITSEYGTSERHLHRPHYHALFFVRGKITPLQMSALIATTWHRGRTDGIPYQPANHVLNNSFTSLSAGAIRSLKYVCKYIQKSCSFQKQINYRLDKIMSNVVQRFENQGLDNWSESSHYWRVKEKIARKINQFHRQSTRLGESALETLDILDLMQTNKVTMPDNDSVVKQFSLPTYYKRKIFYELVEINGAKSWVLNDLGLQYREIQNKKRLHMLTDKLDALHHHVKVDYDSAKLADYLVNTRGRINGFKPSSIDERLASVSYYNYVTRFDADALPLRGLYFDYQGNSVQGYHKRNQLRSMSIKRFIDKYVLFEPKNEQALDAIFAYQQTISRGKQNLYKSKQRLSNLFHYLL